MTVLLYDSPASGNCYKVRLILSLLGIEFERRQLSVVDHSDRPEVLGGLSPSLNVPTVVLDDGRALAESNAILWYFANGTRYLPDDGYERAQVLQWMFFEQYKHDPFPYQQVTRPGQASQSSMARATIFADGPSRR